MTTHAFQASSNINEIDHDPETGDLTVRFHGGRSYPHANVSQDQVDSWKVAPSAGKWYHANLKGNPKHVHPSKAK